MEIRRPRPRRRQQPVRQQRTVVLRAEYITLGQLLKVAGVIGSGGEAKLYLADTVVQVNGEPEQRRGRKLRAGDVIVPPGEDPIMVKAGSLCGDPEAEEDDA